MIDADFVLWLAVAANWLAIVAFVIAVCRAAARGELVLKGS